MSLMKTLAKVAVGVAVAKGASAMMKRSKQGDSRKGQTGRGLLGGLSGSGARDSGGLNGMLGSLLGGGAAGGSLGQGGLGGLLENLGGGRTGGASQGGIGGLLGGLAGAAGAGGMLSGLGGAHQPTHQPPAQNDQNFGAVLNSQFDETPEPAIEPTQDQEAMAALMLKAMIQAAKSDGTFDAEEERKLLDHLGDVTPEDAAFIREQMQKPVDIEELIRETPEGMGPQVYAVSLLAIDLDTRDEAQYLHQLASGYGMDTAQVNDIHDQLGVPSLYT